MKHSSNQSPPGWQIIAILLVLLLGMSDVFGEASRGADIYKLIEIQTEEFVSIKLSREPGSTPCTAGASWNWNESKYQWTSDECHPGRFREVTVQTFGPNDRMLFEGTFEPESNVLYDRQDLGMGARALFCSVRIVHTWVHKDSGEVHTASVDRMESDYPSGENGICRGYGFDR